MERIPKGIRYPLFLLASVIGAASAVFALAVLINVSFSVSDVQAESAFLNPRFCLGGWLNPQGAAGEPVLSGDAEATSYDRTNSAYLAADVSAQMFCGYFMAPERSHPPTLVKVKFQWSATLGEVPVAAPVVEPPVVTPSTAVEVHSSDTGYLVATSTGFSVPAASTTEAVVTEISDVIDATDKPDSDNPATSTTPAVPPETQATSTEPSTQPAADSEARIKDSLYGSIFSLFGPKLANAEASDASRSDDAFLQVSYSFDGVRWTLAGTVGLDNLRGYEVSIPVSSWEEVSDLQVMISVLPSLGRKPEIYLESVTAGVTYDRTVREAVADTASAAAAVLDAAAAALVDAVDPPQEPARPPEPVVREVSKLVFSAGKERLETEKVLPWYDGAFSKHAATKPEGRLDPTVTLSEDGESLIVSGRCSDKYFVILMFKSASDYAEDPNSFVSNIAGPCEGGVFRYDHKVIPATTAEGSYYLLVAEEGSTGPWMPTSSLIPITVERITETIVTP